MTRGGKVRAKFLSVVAVVLSIAMLATACASEPTANRSASGVAGNPVTLPPLSNRSGSGPVAPVFTGSIVRPETWVATSLAPTLEVPDETGAWTFTVSTVGSNGADVQPIVLRSSGTTAQLAVSDGLAQGNAYVWKAEGPEGRMVGGSFQVDVQLRDAQSTDGTGALEVGLSSGEASYTWSSHVMSSVAGQVGFGLRYQGSNTTEAGVPAGWDLEVASDSPFARVIERASGTVGLVSANGSVSNYQRSGTGWVPVSLSSTTPELLGLAPVLVRNASGSWSVVTRDSTSVFIDDDGDGVAELSTVFSQGQAVLSQTASKGRVTSVTDPVSKRRIEFVYGGGSCPRAPSGFVAAPPGMLCQVKFWDGSASDVFYVAAPTGTTIGRIVDFPEAGGNGAKVVDLAWDGSGRIGAVRSALVAAAVASNVVPDADDRFLDVVAYDGAGRVASIAQVAASNDAPRCTRAYEYSSVQSTAVNDSCWGGQVRRIVFDPSTFFVLTDIDQAGLRTTNTWDLRSGHLLRTVGPTGLVTENVYRNGVVVESRGPSRELATAEKTVTGYDQEFSTSPEGVDMKGLDVVYWPSANDAATAGVAELGPRVDGRRSTSLLVNWPSSPAGNDGAWSAIMTGSLEVTTSGKYTFAATSAGTSVRINDILCVDTACVDMDLAEGRQQIRVDLTSARSSGSMDVSWSGPDTGGSSTSIPIDRLRPQYRYTTTMKTVDPTAVRAPAETFTRVSYSSPEKGQIGSSRTQAGLVTTLAYENGSAGRGGWDRESGTTTPGGTSYGFGYWGDTESATAPCPGAKATNQGGGARTTTSPSVSGAADGRTTTAWYDAAGRIVASAVDGGATTCTTYDKGGRTVAVELLEMGSVQRSTSNLAVGGNPLITEVTSVQGALTTTTRSEVDLLGRVVSTTDRYGIVVATAYDPRTGNPSRVTSTAPGGASSIETMTYDAAGRLVTTDIDGRRVASLSYGPTGLLLSTAYGNGLVEARGYDATDRLRSLKWNGPGGELAASSAVLSAAGTMSSLTSTAGGRSSTFEYTFDTAMRLTSASVTAGLVPNATTWTYAYDTNSNRVGQAITRDGAPVGDWTYAYDGAARLTSTNDPAVSGGLEYDGRGTATKVGADSFAYDAADHLISATDGRRTVDYERDVAGVVVAKTTTVDGNATTIRYGSGGYLLGSNGAVVGRQVQLSTGAILDLAPSASAWRFVGLDGNLFIVTDDTGARSGEAQVFEPFGRRLTTAVATPATLPSSEWQASEGLETETLALPFVMMGERVYLPTLGRYIQTDPVVGGSANPYDYVDQDPVNGRDPSGESTTKIIITGVALIAATIANFFIGNWAGAFITAKSGWAMLGGAALSGALTGVATDLVANGLVVGGLHLLGRSEEVEWDWNEFAAGVVIAAVTGGISGYLPAAKAARDAAKAAQAANVAGAGAAAGAAQAAPLAAGQIAVQAPVVAPRQTVALSQAGGRQVSQRISGGPANLVRQPSNRISIESDYLTCRGSYRSAA